VTFREWDAYVAHGECSRPDDQGWGRGAQPVINISWDNARAYVRWLSRKTGSDCRLPSEAEWEYAARAGTTAEYALPAPHGSNDIQGNGLANCGNCGSDWDNLRPAPVASFEPNAWGLYDMHGNVWEWIEDCLHPSYNGSPEDGGPWGHENGGDCSFRMLRGGDWVSRHDRARSACRGWDSRHDRDSNIGFRVVCSSAVSERTSIRQEL
jgi:formylglycine-generating enzyme required for sulfatase activity